MFGWLRGMFKKPGVEHVLSTMPGTEECLRVPEQGLPIGDEEVVPEKTRNWLCDHGWHKPVPSLELAYLHCVCKYCGKEFGTLMTTEELAEKGFLEIESSPAAPPPGAMNDTGEDNNHS